MSDFGRGLRPECLKSLYQLMAEPGSNWWKDLPMLWRPSGVAAGDRGLRLSIRNNYLNFYLRGQSIARVGFTRGHQPYVRTHVKYVFGRDGMTPEYTRLQGTEIVHPMNTEQLAYQGESTLNEWIGRADRYKGEEKRQVDILVADNPAIVDLEMGLPAIDAQKAALRVDCVALEREPDRLRIVFWEAKRFEDSRLRAEAAPEIFGQVERYREYLSDAKRVQRVEEAYRQVCRLLLEISSMAVSLGNPVALSPAIAEAAAVGSRLRVDPELRLVIFSCKNHPKRDSWPVHENKLKVQKIPYLIFEDEPFTLRRPEMLG